MRAARRAWLPALVLAAALAADPAPGARADEPHAAAALLARLRRAGRVEVGIEGRAESEAGARALRGRLALEPPDRARLDVATTGESITCRGDGGEWLQPALGQMLRLGPGRVAPLLDVWSLLLGGGRARLDERALGGGRFLLVPRGRSAVDSAWVTLGRDGLPARLETRLGDERASWRLSGWRFARARGRSAFVLRAPRGVEVVPLD